MREAYSLAWSVPVLLFRSRVSLEAEILILRHQLNIQRRHAVWQSPLVKARIGRYIDQTLVLETTAGSFHGA
jgi:hypothetical protein